MSQFEGSEMDRSPGSPYDRGNADADYDRSPRPHKMVPNEQGGRDMQKLTDPKEVEEYHAGYEAGKGEPTHYPDDDLDEAKDELENEDDLEEGIVGSMKKFGNALNIPVGAKKFPGAEIPARAINAIQRNRTASALKNMNKVGDNPDSTASDHDRAVTDYGQRRDNMTGREKVGESLTITATDNDAYGLMRMVSLAGVPGAAKVEPIEPYSPYSAHADMPVGGVIYDGDSTGCSAVNCSDSNCPTHGHDMMPMEEYANEPDESTCEVSSVTDNAGLGGLNGSKRQHPFAANKSDNPLAKDDADISERATKLAGMYNKFKGK